MSNQSAPCPECGKFVFAERRDCPYCKAIYSDIERSAMFPAVKESPAIEPPREDNPLMIVALAVLTVFMLMVWFGFGVG